MLFGHDEGKNIKQLCDGTKDVVCIKMGGTGATTAAGARNNLGLGNTSGAVPIANGGTGATTVAGARNNLGLGNTSGAVPIANGGTGATTAEGAFRNLGIDDYVVEEGAGTASGSYYRKWASGRAEYWHKFNPGSLTIGTARGNMYSGAYFDSSFESGLFNGVPQVNCYAHLSSDSYVIGTQVKTISKDSVTLRLWASGNVASNSGYNVHIYAFGTWK